MVFKLFPSVPPQSGGFQDATFNVGPLRMRGVWLTDTPRPGATEATFLDIDPGRLAWYRVESSITGERGWCVPAAVVAACTVPSLDAGRADIGPCGDVPTILPPMTLAEMAAETWG